MRTRGDWQWWSSVGAEIEPLVEELLETLSPHESLLQRTVAEGCDAQLSVHGHIVGDYVDTVDGLVERDYPEDAPLPMLDSDDVRIVLPPLAMRFLGALPATFWADIGIMFDHYGPRDPLGPRWKPIDWAAKRADLGIQIGTRANNRDPIELPPNARQRFGARDRSAG